MNQERNRKRNRPMVTATIDPKIHREFERIVEQIDLNKSKVVEKAIEQWIENVGKKLIKTIEDAKKEGLRIIIFHMPAVIF